MNSPIVTKDEFNRDGICEGCNENAGEECSSCDNIACSECIEEFSRSEDDKRCRICADDEPECDEGCGTTLTEDTHIMCWVSKDKEEKTVCRACYEDCGYKETDTNSDNEEEEDEYEFISYGIKRIYKVIIQVAGGGMGNGNAYATVEGEWDCEDDFVNGEDGEIHYCEYGNNPVREWRGVRIRYSDDGNSFKIEE